MANSSCLYCDIVVDQHCLQCNKCSWYGRHGQACAFSHPPMCYNFLRNGSSGCTKGSHCEYTHPKVCRASLSTGKCIHRNCHYYHKSGTHRSIPKTTENSRPSHERVSRSNRATPLMNLNLHPCKHIFYKLYSYPTSNTSHHTWPTRTRPPLLLNPHLNVSYSNKKLMMHPSHSYLFF